MPVATYTKTGNKATTAAKLDKAVFAVGIKNHELLKQAYLSYLASKRINLALTKKRGEVRGGGRKPWRQKGTGRARFGSIRNPIWRGGGITFGPTGEENYSVKLHAKAKRQAVKQALTLAAEAGKVKIIEDFDFKAAKVSPIVKLLNKMNLEGSNLLVVETIDEQAQRSTSNLPNVKLSTANRLTVFAILNADNIVISKNALPVINDWLVGSKAKKEVK